MSYAIEASMLDIPQPGGPHSFWGYDLSTLSIDEVATVVNSVANSIEDELSATGYLWYTSGVTHVSGSYLATLSDEQRDSYLAEIELNFDGMLNGQKDYLSNMRDGHSSEHDYGDNAAQYLSQQAAAYYDSLTINATISRNLTTVAQDIFKQNPNNTDLAQHLLAQYLVNNGYGNLVSGYHADGMYNGHYVGGSSSSEGTLITVTAGRYIPGFSGFFGSHAAFDFGPDYGNNSGGGGSHGGDTPPSPPEVPAHAPTGDVHASDFTLKLAQDEDGNDVPVDPKDLANFETALGYLSQSPTAEAMLKTAVEQGVKIYLNHDGVTRYNPDTNVLSFDPLMGARVDIAGTPFFNVISPVQALMHEIGHVIGFTNPVATGDRYDDTEERRVILGTDLTIANELGLPVRDTHEGRPYYVPNPSDVVRSSDQVRGQYPPAPPPPSNPGYTPPYYDPYSPPPYYDDPNDYR